MKQIEINKPLWVKEVYLRNNPPITNCFVWVYCNFLVVAKDEQAHVTTWYNLDFVDKLEGVEKIDRRV